jgi:hypothetical protein
VVPLFLVPSGGLAVVLAALVVLAVLALLLLAPAIPARALLALVLTLALLAAAGSQGASQATFSHHSLRLRLQLTAQAPKTDSAAWSVPAQTTEGWE